MSEREWSEELPPTSNANNNRGKGRWQQLIKLAKEYPGFWTYEVVPTVATARSIAANLKRPTRWDARDKIETAARTVDGEPRVYIRWVGDAS